MQLLWKIAQKSLKKLKIGLPFNPASLLLGIFPKLLKSSTEEWIKEIWYIYMMEYYLAIKRNKITPFTATQKDLATVTVKSDRHRKMNVTTYCLCELIYSAEVDSQIQKTSLWLLGINWEIESDMYTPLYIKQVTNKGLLRSTGNSTQYSNDLSGRRILKKKGEDICIHVIDSL